MKRKFKIILFLTILIFSQLLLGLIIIFLLPALSKSSEVIHLKQDPKYVRYKLDDKLNEKQFWFYESIFDSNRLMKQEQHPLKLKFNKSILNNLDKNKDLSYLLLNVFGFNKNKEVCELKTYYRVNNSLNYLELLIIWAFKKNNSKIIIDNKIYYDILNINILS